MPEKLSLKNEEKAIFALRSLYESYGYSRYKMSKFEEYDLYANNKDFLISDNIITFTDMSGKLMALKPDVTLSIIKNNRDKVNPVNKVYYNENVYRISKSTESFKEIMQVGLEALGEVDDYCILEVLQLAAKSLTTISESAVLDISHLGLIYEIIDELDIHTSSKLEILKLIGEKNPHELISLCDKLGIENETAQKLKALISIHGKPKEALAALKSLLGESQALSQLERILSAFGEANDIINIDFSAVPDTKYYNGFVFKGYIEGIPESILSGGQYDRLMKKMKIDEKAIGFAVYLDMLEALETEDEPFDLDAVLLYDDSCSLLSLQKAIDSLIALGKTVKAQKEKPQKIKYKELLKLTEKGVEILENNA